MVFTQASPLPGRCGMWPWLAYSVCFPPICPLPALGRGSPMPCSSCDTWAALPVLSMGLHLPMSTDKVLRVGRSAAASTYRQAPSRLCSASGQLTLVSSLGRRDSIEDSVKVS